MAPPAFVFAGTWAVSSGMAAHLPRLLQTAGASVAVPVSPPVGPARMLDRTGSGVPSGSAGLNLISTAAPPVSRVPARC